MDDWGDPWAETAENTNIKRPPAISNDNVKPSIFGGFEDEAGWGDWETAAPGPWGESQSNTFGTEAREPSEASDTYLNEDTLATETTSPSLGDWQDPPTWNAVHLEEASLGQQLEGPHLGLGGHITEWDGNLRQHSTSEASTIVTNDTHAEILGHHAASDITFSHPVVEDGSSILSSIASSGVSVNYEKPQDSPRTSIDSGIHLKADEEITSSKKSFGVVHAERIIDGYLEKGGIAVPGHEIGNVVVDGEGSTPSSGSGNGLGIDVVIDREHKHAFNDTAVFQADLSLIDSLYPARKGPSTQQPPLDTLISTTSARKAWYRLTRGQTLREFNKGDADDNYIRVAWPDSAIRSEVLRTVARWTVEDKANGGRTNLGGRPGASFSWGDFKSDVKPVHRPGFSLSGDTRSFSTELCSPTSPKHRTTRSVSARAFVESPNDIAQFNWSSSANTAALPILPKVPAKDFERAVEHDDQRIDGGTASHIGHSRQSASLSIAAEQAPATLHRRSATNVISSSNLEEALSLTTRRDFQFPLTRNGALSSENERAQTPKDADAPDVSSVQPGTGSTITQAPDDDEDEEWGDMVGASPTPEIISTPALVPQEVTSAPSSADADNISVQKRRPPDIVLPLSKQPLLIPRVLSPSRKAAFEAARVSRTLSSQVSDPPPLTLDTTQPTLQRQPSVAKLRSSLSATPTSPWRPSPSLRESPFSSQALSPSSKISASSSHSPVASEATRPIADTDWWLQPSFTQEEFGMIEASLEREAPERVQMEISEAALEIIRGLPDLSYML